MKSTLFTTGALALAPPTAIQRHGRSRHPLLLGTLMLLMVVGVLAGGGWFYHRQEQLMRREVEVSLESIAQLKLDQIVGWRRERLGDAKVLMESEFFKEAVLRWLAHPDGELGNKIRARLRAMEEYNQYSDVILVDRQGKIRMRVPDSSVTLHAESLRALATAFQTQKVVMVDLHESPGDPSMHLGIISPIRFGDKPTNESIGAVVLRFEGEQFLYPMLQHWPTASASGETLLVRREGDSVLFLNELRHQRHAALKLRFPLSQKKTRPCRPH